MGGKRRFNPEDDSYSRANKKYRAAEEQQQQHYSAHRPRTAKRTRKLEDQQKLSLTWARKRIRTIERALKHEPETMEPGVAIDLKNELAGLKAQIDRRQLQQQRSHMIGKYHMIRFFERKKAMRLQKQLTRRIAETEDPEQRQKLEADKHIAEVDQMYALYYPFMEPYVSLYPKGEKDGDDEKDKNDKKDKKEKKDKKKKTKEDDKEDSKDGDNDKEDYESSKAAQALRAPRPPLWTEVETRMSKGGVASLEKLRDRLPPSKGKKGGKANEEDKEGDREGDEEEDTNEQDDDDDFFSD